MADTAARPVKFGLTNVYYAVLGEGGEYGTPKRIYGGVSLTCTPEGDSSTFHADNQPYFVQTVNSGYTGTLEVAFAEDEFLKDVLGYEVDNNKLLVEFTDATPATFALMFEVSSNVKPQRTVFYACTLSRPQSDANTTSDTIEPDTVSLDFTAIAREFSFGASTRPAVKGVLTKTDDSATSYEAFYQEVMIPAAPTGATGSTGDTGLQA